MTGGEGPPDARRGAGSAVAGERERRVAGALVRQGLRLAVAESCTGGLLAARLTARAGASRYLDAGLVTYSDRAKEQLLGVDPETLAAEGAVSGAVVRQMAVGARDRTGARAAVAITGIAGPGGGTPTKPVGTVWIAAALDDEIRVVRRRFDGDRDAVRHAAVDAALDLLAGLLDTREAPDA
ncbi:MAG: CinA family protein [Gemmatimonadota bacterium]